MKADRDIKRLRDWETATPVPSPDNSIALPLRRKRKVKYGAVLLAGFVLAGFAYIPILREFASFLIVENPLRPAAAIIALGGQTPFREMEAAKLYRAGWAPLVVIVREAGTKESKALENLGIQVGRFWELRREVLIREGVPPDAIVVSQEGAEGTLEELRAAHGSLQSKDSPVILVTSKYHTRRTGLTWKYVTEGKSQTIVRAAGLDPFDPERWWHQRRFVLSVVREYLGLINYYAGFPVAP